jgi:hypothetical protein
LNGLVKVLGCNRNTVEKKISKGDYPITSITANNRTYPAYIVTREQLQKLDFEIAQNKGGTVTPLKRNNNKSASSYIDRLQSAGVTAQEDVAEGSYNDYTSNMLRNVKKSESVDELVQAKLVQAELKEKIADLKGNVARLEADKSIMESKILLIEDKSKTFEGEVSRLTQEHAQLNNIIKSKDKTITILATIIVVAVTIAITVAVMLHFIR